MAADMLTNLVRELDDHDLSVLHTRNTQNGSVGVACVNPLHKKISPPGHASVLHTFEAVVGRWKSGRVVSAPSVGRVIWMEPQSEIKIENRLVKWHLEKWHLGSFFCKCCQPQIRWYDIYRCRWNVLHSVNVHYWTVQWCSSMCSSAQMATHFAYSLLKAVVMWPCNLICNHNHAGISGITWTHNMVAAQNCAMTSKQLQHKFQSARRSRSDVETDNAKQWTHQRAGWSKLHRSKTELDKTKL